MDTIQLEKVSSKLSDFVENFSDIFGWQRRIKHCKTYLTGLLLDGERKSIDPLASRLEGADNQALQQFVNQSPWDGFALQKALRQFMIKSLNMNKAVYVLDDTSLPKKGNHSVGVGRQYCGALGKIANCQSIVSLQAVGSHHHFPLAASLYLPESWTSDKTRMEKVGIPEAHQCFKEKWRIALDLFDECARDIAAEAFLFDAGYGANRIFLKELDDRGIKFVGGLKGDETFWAADAELVSSQKNTGGRPRKHIVPVEKDSKALTTKEWAQKLFAEKDNIKKTKIPHKIPIVVEFVATRVLEVGRRPRPHIGVERWLIIERLKDGTFKYFVSNLEEKKDPKEIILLAHQRYKIEQGYQQLKEEIGFDHFEGRSWNGLHHHIALCFMAYDFLQTLIKSKSRGKKSGTNIARGTKVDK